MGSAAAYVIDEEKKDEIRKGLVSGGDEAALGLPKGETLVQLSYSVKPTAENPEPLLLFSNFNFTQCVVARPFRRYDGADFSFAEFGATSTSSPPPYIPTTLSTPPPSPLSCPVLPSHQVSASPRAPSSAVISSSLALSSRTPSTTSPFGRSTSGRVAE
jgi:hypothetical protein